MARYDKYDPISGGFRAKLAADLTMDANGEFGPAGVSLNTTGRVVVGTGGQSGLVGVLVKNAARQGTGRWSNTLHGIPNPAAPIGAMAGDVVDIMTNGEIVDLDPDDFPAGSAVYTAADGTLSTTGGAGTSQVGWTVEAGRMVVRVPAGAAVGA